MVSVQYRVHPTALLSKSRRANVCEARRAAAVLLRARGLSLHEIGRELRRDHSTVHYMLDRVRTGPLRPFEQRTLDNCRRLLGL